MANELLLETGDQLLLETGGTDYLLLEAPSVPGTLDTDFGELTIALTGTVHSPVSGVLTADFGTMTIALTGTVHSTVFGVLTASFGALTATLAGVPFAPDATYANLQPSLWQADLTTNVNVGELWAADLLPSLWQADLQ